jgi:hypothetical protein
MTDVSDLMHNLQNPGGERQTWRRVKRVTNTIANLATVAPKLLDAWQQVESLIQRH